MPIRRYFQNVAPFWDKHDTRFAFLLVAILVISYGTFVETISLSGLRTAWIAFIENSGLLALLSAPTAVIALYRLRHREDKTRPSVREDFRELNNEDAMDFGLRNYGPGPALYVQAVVTVETQQKQTEVARFQTHDPPIHLREGDFASLVLSVEDDWVNEMAEKCEVSQSENDDDGEQENPPMVNLYYSYVSQSGAREPTSISTERDNTDVLDEIKRPDADARRIELSRVDDAC